MDVGTGTRETRQGHETIQGEVELYFNALRYLSCHLSRFNIGCFRNHWKCKGVGEKRKDGVCGIQGRM